MVQLIHDNLANVVPAVRLAALDCQADRGLARARVMYPDAEAVVPRFH